MTKADDTLVDNAILTRCDREWQKVAMIIAKTRIELMPGEVRDDIIEDVIAGRIAELAKLGKLESRGDTSDVRASEIRLPASQD